MEKYTEAKSCISGADDLFKFRVTEIMLISTEYDAYVLEEDGQLAEKIYHQFSDLSLPYIPRIHWVASSEEAFETLKKIPIHLVISMSRANDMSSFDFERTIHEVYPEIPIVMLSYERLTRFCWQSLNMLKISRTLLTIVSLVYRQFYWLKIHQYITRKFCLLYIRKYCHKQGTWFYMP